MAWSSATSRIGPSQFDVVRASTHIFNTEEDVNRLCSAIRKKFA